MTIEEYARQIARELQECSCGQKLDTKATPYLGDVKQMCRKCGKLHNVDTVSPDWERIKKGGTES